MTRIAVVTAYIIGAAVLDIAILAMPIPIGLAAGLAPLLAGVLVGVLASSKKTAIIYSLAAAIIAVALSLLYNYLQAPVETILVLARPGAMSLLPVIVQLVVAILAALGTRLLIETYGEAVKGE